MFKETSSEPFIEIHKQNKKKATRELEQGDDTQEPLHADS